MYVCYNYLTPHIFIVEIHCISQKGIYADNQIISLLLCSYFRDGIFQENIVQLDS